MICTNCKREAAVIVKVLSDEHPYAGEFWCPTCIVRAAHPSAFPMDDPEITAIYG